MNQLLCGVDPFFDRGLYEVRDGTANLFFVDTRGDAPMARIINTADKAALTDRVRLKAVASLGRHSDRVWSGIDVYEGAAAQDPDTRDGILRTGHQHHFAIEQSEFGESLHDVCTTIVRAREAR